MAPGRSRASCWLELAQALAVDGLGLHTGGGLALGEHAQPVERLLPRRDDEAALELELGGRRDLRVKFTPQPARQQRELELGARLLVGDENVALARAGRPRGDRPSVEHGHGQPGLRQVVRARGADGARTDHDDVTGGGGRAHPGGPASTIARAV